MRLFASLDIHYNNSLHRKVQKQHETEIKKLQTKVIDSMIFGIHCNTFFQPTSAFPKYLVETNYEKLSVINVNNTNILF